MPEKNSKNSINSSALEALLSAHDGDMALLYLYILKNGSLDAEDAAIKLCRTGSEIAAAEEKLRRLDIISSDTLSAAGEIIPASGSRSSAKASPAPEEIQEPEDKIPEYSSDELIRRTRADGVFTGLIAECAKVIGHSLSTADMKMLFGIYDYLALPPEVIMELLNYCGEVVAEKYGSGRRPGMKAIEKQAYIWARQEILTFERAEEYITEQRQRRSKLGAIAPLLGIRDRQLSSSEIKYINSWLDMGFNEDAIAIAYDRTVIGAGSLKWAYMNKILLNWHEHKLHTADEINANDSRRPRGPAAQGSSEAPSIDMEELRRAINKI